MRTLRIEYKTDELCRLDGIYVTLCIHRTKKLFRGNTWIPMCDSGLVAHEVTWIWLRNLNRRLKGCSGRKEKDNNALYC